MKPKKKALKLKSLAAITRNDWIVKSSILDDFFILVVIYSKHSDQTIIRHFLDDVDAAKFINMIVERDPTIIIEFDRERER